MDKIGFLSTVKRLSSLLNENFKEIIILLNFSIKLIILNNPNS